LRGLEGEGGAEVSRSKAPVMVWALPKWWDGAKEHRPPWIVEGGCDMVLRNYTSQSQHHEKFLISK
jgi:hypothetical protein